MRNILIGIACVASLVAQAQKDEAITEIIQLDFTPHKELNITWVFPSIPDLKIDYKDILLKAGINSVSEVTKMSLLLNGIPHATEVRGRGFIKKSHPEYDVYVEQNVSLREGGNVLKFVIQNANGERKVVERTIIVSTQKDIIVNRQDYALLFAIDEYDDDKWKDLTNPINDARAIAFELEESYGFNVELIENFTQDEVILKLREYAEKSYDEYDQLLIFFAGHGQFDELLGQGYIVSKNSRMNDIAKSSYISHAVLRNAIDNIPNQHILLTMDVCFGGTFDPIIARSGSRGGEDMYKEIETNEFINRKLRYKTRKYITSGGKQYVPDGRPGMHSPFANKFLEALRSYGGRDNIITLPELYGWLEKINPEPRVGGFGTNEAGSDFVFVSTINN